METIYFFSLLIVSSFKNRTKEGLINVPLLGLTPKDVARMIITKFYNLIQFFLGVVIIT